MSEFLPITAVFSEPFAVPGGCTCPLDLQLKTGDWLMQNQTQKNLRVFSSGMWAGRWTGIWDEGLEKTEV